MGDESTGNLGSHNAQNVFNIFQRAEHQTRFILTCGDT